MKKRFAVIVPVLLCVILLSTAFAPAKMTTEAVTAAETEVSAPAARFLNMLNHNYAYNGAFLSFDELSQSAVIANLDLREGDYISETYIKGFLFDMYGLNAVSFSQEDAPEQRPGYLYITPLGYTRYVHYNPNVSENEDGTFTVITDVTVYPHDAAAYETFAVTLFAPNENSAFGYVIVYSDLDPPSVNV